MSDILSAVGLPESHLDLYPHEISGGQQRRVGLARILTLQPTLVVLDEPTSGLDVSVQATVLNLFLDLQKQFDLTYVFISHDLSVVRMICDRVAVMYLGKVVELGPTERLFSAPTPPLYALAAVRDPADRQAADHRYLLAGRRAARPRQPAVGLPFPHPLPVGRAAMRSRNSALIEHLPGHADACLFSDRAVPEA